MPRGDYRLLLGGGAVSLVAVVVLSIGHTLSWSFLQLESRWLVVAGVPLLVGLVAGGFIRSFKGFGIEVEAGLDQPVPDAEVQLVDGRDVDVAALAEEAEGMMKSSLGRVNRLSDTQRGEIRRLGFVSGPSAFYSPDILREYLSILPNLRYLEVRDPGGGLRYVVDRRGLSPERAGDFVESLRSGNLEATFGRWLIRRFLDPGEKLGSLVEKFRDTGAEALPVVDGGRIVGSLGRTAVFQQLADVVLRSARS